MADWANPLFEKMNGDACSSFLGNVDLIDVPSERDRIQPLSPDSLSVAGF